MQVRRALIPAPAKGLPSGYLANIEERLAQTEVALLQALSTLHASEVRVRPEQHQLLVSDRAAGKARELEFNEVRIARVEEWKKFPLETPEQQLLWTRSRLTTTETPPTKDSAESWKDTTHLMRNSRKRRHYGETGQAESERQKAALEGRDPLDLEVDHGSDSIVLTASPSIIHSAQSMHDDLAAGSFYDNRLSAPSAAVSTLQRQNTNVPSPTLRSISELPRVDDPDISGAAQEEPPEQYISKAKKLVFSHSRRYF
ncbi:hypothetical protein E4T44_03686 [Aureobasidium sp. EXF-8845]|nr:hypothetical protein E4T44_03686 [Aureobasidium sp. EXF-8845]KAI4854898.1 hypothetical protein E4T45_03669 [Aureobasidium sp. EXF-8846]